MIVNYDRKGFIVQATAYSARGSVTNKKRSIRLRPERELVEVSTAEKPPEVDVVKLFSSH